MSAIPRSRQAVLTALYRDTASLGPPYIGIPPYSDRLISGYSLTRTALYRDTALLRPSHIGIPPYSDRLISGYRLTQTALLGRLLLYVIRCATQDNPACAARWQVLQLKESTPLRACFVWVHLCMTRHVLWVRLCMTLHALWVRLSVRLLFAYCSF